MGRVDIPVLQLVLRAHHTSTCSEVGMPVGRCPPPLPLFVAVERGLVGPVRVLIRQVHAYVFI